MKRPVKRKLRVDRIIVALLLLIGLILLIGKIPIFNIKNIIIEGNQSVKNDQIIKSSKIVGGDSLIYLSKKTIRSNILQIPWLKDVKINRRLPWTLKITVEEREPVAYAQVQNDYIIIDSEGIIFERRKNTSPAMTFIKGIENNKNIKIGNPIYTCGTDGQNQLLKEVFLENDYKKFKSINLEEDKVSMVLKNDVDVSFGSYNDIDYKLSVLDIMYNKLLESEEKATMILMEDGPNPILVRSTD